MTRTIRKLAACAVLILASAQAGLAWEPGVPTVLPPGNTMGVPVGANPPPGLFFSLRSGYWDAKLADDKGDDAGQSNTLADTALQFHWVPGIKILGGDYKAMITLPLISNDQTRDAPFPPPLQGSDSRFALGNIEIAPIGLSWQIQPGIFVSSGLSIFAPTGKFDPDAAVNTGGDFWTFAPSVGYSYLRDGWNASVHATYFTTTENRESDYKSGDEILVNATALKDMGGWSVGPVGYWRKQLTADDNNGTSYGGTVSGKAEQLGLGIGLTRQFGKVEANLNLTDDVYLRNAVGGPKLWLNLSMPLGGRG